MKKDKGPDLINDNLINSFNFGLIGLNNDNLFLNKTNDITSYDFNGNQLKILLTYDRKKYKTMVVKDSFLALSDGDFMLYKIDKSGQLIEISKAANLRGGAYTSEILRVDSVILLNDNRFSSTLRTNQTDNIYPQALVLIKYDAKDNLISSFNPSHHYSFESTSSTVLQDSLVFYMNNKISKFNLFEPDPKVKTFDFKFNPENNMTSTVSKGNQIYTSNSKNIYLIEYAGNAIILKGEVK